MAGVDRRALPAREVELLARLVRPDEADQRHAVAVHVGDDLVVERVEVAGVREDVDPVRGWRQDRLRPVEGVLEVRAGRPGAGGRVGPVGDLGLQPVVGVRVLAALLGEVVAPRQVDRDLRRGRAAPVRRLLLAEVGRKDPGGAAALPPGLSASAAPSPAMDAATFAARSALAFARACCSGVLWWSFDRPRAGLPGRRVPAWRRGPPSAAPGRSTQPNRTAGVTTFGCFTLTTSSRGRTPGGNQRGTPGSLLRAVLLPRRKRVASIADGDVEPAAYARLISGGVVL